MPQALSIVAVLVTLMMFAFSMQLMSIAPQYVTFGDQKLRGRSGDVDAEACTLRESNIREAGTEDRTGGLGCQMTMIAQLYIKIQLTVPLFSLIYFLLSWVFIACFCVFLVYHAHFKKSY
mmetsp:Transcript_1409/g.2477  ORF Transcript_1409/g.2477 Transcript_1409/m.2477 type:complete len:120 (+) Transcript_1409:1978-2337(+)